MKFRSTPFLVALFCVSICGCTRPNEGNSMISAAPREQSFSENDEVFFIFKSSSMSAVTVAAPSGFYVKGRVQNGQFAPESGILGEGDFAVTGQNGWIELASGKFYPMHTAKTPMSPFVEGHMTDSGFVPSSREIK